MIYKTGFTENPKEYNNRIGAAISQSIKNGTSFGCISSRACENCGIINTDSICLCSPSFICCECGFETGKNIRELFSISKISADNIIGIE